MHFLILVLISSTKSDSQLSWIFIIARFCVCQQIIERNGLMFSTPYALACSPWGGARGGISPVWITFRTPLKTAEKNGGWGKFTPKAKSNYKNDQNLANISTFMAIQRNSGKIG